MTYKDELGFVGHPELPHGYLPYLGAHPRRRDDWIGRLALAAGTMLLFPFAIVLGHVSLGRFRAGSARNRRAAVGALWLGYGAPTVAAFGFAVALMWIAAAGVGLLG
ncbi:hypothetical protein [Demequina mangrovi]|uniref:DUF4190 domain-containing protein n=1 Tax=Demequina mangrovi TaxID=1043493 RepID=A0A1H6XIZ5_9MICO|nr:hypothetical protein [Demequina mangrovi]SEJ24842.1 hypothetical protein SAMN05421637_1316 [Demequina mangrovi]